MTVIIIALCIVCPPLGFAIVFGLLALINRGFAAFMGVIAAMAIALISFLEIYILLIFAIPLLIWSIICFVFNISKKK